MVSSCTYLGANDTCFEEFDFMLCLSGFSIGSDGDREEAELFDFYKSGFFFFLNSSTVVIYSFVRRTRLNVSLLPSLRPICDVMRGECWIGYCAIFIVGFPPDTVIYVCPLGGCI